MKPIPILSQTKEPYKDYLLLERSLARSTIVAYLKDIQTLIKVIGDISVSDITLDDLRMWQRSMKSNSVSDTTIRRRIHSMNTYFTWLRIEGYVTDELSRLLHLPKRRKLIPKTLSAEQLRTFVDTPSPHRLAWQMMAWMALRRAEVTGVRWEDVQWGSRRIIVGNPI